MSEFSCLTCFQHPGVNFLNIQSENNDTVYEALRKHFWFTEDRYQKAVICQPCWDQVDRFHRFYVSVEELHQHRLVSVLVKREPEADEDSEALPATTCGVCGHVCPTENALRMHKSRKHSSPTPVHPSNTENSDCFDLAAIENLHQQTMVSFLVKTELEAGENEHLEESFTVKSDNMIGVSNLLDNSYIVAGEDNSMERSTLGNDDETSYNGLTCDVCFKGGFQTKQSFIAHMLQHGRKKQCAVCSRWFKSSRSWSLHMSKHHPTAQPETSCNVCGHVCSTENALRMHKSRKHSSPTPMHPSNHAVEDDNEPQDGSDLNTTEVLGQVQPVSMIVNAEPDQAESFPTPNDSTNDGDDEMKDNSNVVESGLLSPQHGQNKQCKICSRWLPNPRNWSKHMNKHHPNAQPATTCGICGHVTPSKNALSMHIYRKHRVAHQDNTSSSDLIQSFDAEEGGMNELSRIKTEPEVDENSLEEDSLMQSNMTTADEVGFLETKDNLKKPMLFRCTVQLCTHTFENSRSLSKHMSRHHPEAKPEITCDICGHITRTKNALNMHKHRKHRVRKQSQEELFI